MEKSAKKSRKILIIDDEEAIRDGCQQVLTRKGYHVDCAGDAVNGLQMGLRNFYDVILLDVRMPNVSGMDILKKLNALLSSAYKNVTKLEAAVAKAQATGDAVKQAEAYRDKVFTVMQTLRIDIDAMEMIVPRDTWPVPTYTELLFKL